MRNWHNSKVELLCEIIALSPIHLPAKQSGEVFWCLHAKWSQSKRCINNLTSKCNFLENRGVWTRLAGLHYTAHNAASVYFQECWKLDLNALLFAYTSLGGPMQTLAELHGHEIGTAVYFRMSRRQGEYWELPALFIKETVGMPLQAEWVASGSSQHNGWFFVIFLFL